MCSASWYASPEKGMAASAFRGVDICWLRRIWLQLPRYYVGTNRNKIVRSYLIDYVHTLPTAEIS